MELPTHLLRVIIACTSGSTTLKNVLDSISECKLPQVYEKTLIVENGGPSLLEDLVLSYNERLNTEYLHISESGKNRALNTALRNIERGLIFFTDDDIYLGEHTLSAYATAAKRAGWGHFFGGPFDVTYEDEPPPEWLLPYLPPSAKGWAPDETDIADDFFGFVGFNWAGFAQDIHNAGRFKVDVGPGSRINSTGSETQLQLDLVQNGACAVYVPEATVTHRVPPNKCTPEWALHRSYRNGLQWGQFYYHNEFTDKMSTLWDYPLWMVKLLLKRAAQAGVKSFMNAQRRFDGRYWLNWQWGYIQGFRHARELARRDS